MAQSPEHTRRMIARGYAAVVILLGLAFLGVMALLIAAFGMRSADARFIALMVTPAGIAFALAAFIWRQQAWALLAALASAVLLRFVFAGADPVVDMLFVSFAVLCAIFTATYFYLGGRTAGTADRA